MTMLQRSNRAVSTGPGLPRVLGRYGGVRPGPVLIAVGGIHGNEPAGIESSRRILRRLQESRPDLTGEVVFVAGNLRALAKDRRFLERDLNRAWIPDRIRGVLRPDPRSEPAPEDLEQRELLAVLDETLERATGNAYLLDLHTSSAPGKPFLTVGDTLRNREFASRFPLPRILGLEEQVDGALLEYLNNRGLVTLGVEAGRHDAPESVDAMEAVLWIALIGTRQLSPAAVPGLAALRSMLRDRSRGVPPVIEVRHRHAITPRDRFRMEPGFANFDPVERGRLLARDRKGEIRAPEDGLVLLPLYQGQGNDGFFLARKISPWSLRASSILRRTGLPAMLPYLPGVRRHPERADVLVVNTRVARVRALDLLRMMGYRKLRRQGALLLVSRRRHDRRPPARFRASPAD